MDVSMDDVEGAGETDPKKEKCTKYKVPWNMNELESIIDSTLSDLGLATQLESSLTNLNTTLRTQERKTKEINKIFRECEDQLKRFQDELDADKIPVPEKIPSDHDSDDDVQLVDITYEARPKQTPQQMLMEALKKAGNMQPGTYYLQKDGVLKPLTPGQNPPPGSQLVSVKSTNQNQQPIKQGLPVQKYNDVIPLASVQPPRAGVMPAMPKFIELAEGMKLYAKKNNEIWYKGTLVEIQNKDASVEERRYKIKYDGKGMKQLDGRGVAFVDPPSSTLPVGSRIIALYIDEDSEPRASFYAGIVAESPSVRNNNRYLVFFDDGYAQYSTFRDVRKVCYQSKNVWDDIDPSSQSFIKNYLVQYPERPMVRLQKGQIIKTEWNGRWWIARVQDVDASLVKMYFDADKRVEWIYRGSTRLEPLYTELANAEASKAAGKGRRHNLSHKNNRKPFVEYTRQGQDDSHIQAIDLDGPSPEDHPAMRKSNMVPESNGKRRPVARKSTVNTKIERQNSHESGGKKLVASSISSNRTGLDMASIIQNKLGQKNEEIDEEALGERVDIDRHLSDTIRKCFKPHRCYAGCLKDVDDDPIKLKGNNPLLIPMLCGWERQIAKQRNSGKRSVFYRGPCARRLRSIYEVDSYLKITDSQLTIDMFCYDPNLHTDSEFVPIKTFCDIKDLSYGKENVPISCVNGIDRQYPDYVDYSIVRTPAKGVHLNLDEEYLCGCDCTDGCRDRNKCACIQMTIQASAATPINVPDPEVGYEERRLNGYISTGIYECNARCKCDRRCANRVAQNGLQLRLQVFKTEKRGWGLRCLDDIPAGGFICVYAGQLLTEQGANEDGQQYGDEYLAELDFIEVVERGKEGYESDVEDIDEGIGDEASDRDHIPTDSDSTYSGEKRFLNRVKNTPRSPRSMTPVKVKDVMSPQNKVKEWVKSLPPGPILIISSDEDEPSSKDNADDVQDKDSDLDSLGEKKLDRPTSQPGNKKLTIKLSGASGNPGNGSSKKSTGKIGTEAVRNGTGACKTGAEAGKIDNDMGDDTCVIIDDDESKPRQDVSGKSKLDDTKKPDEANENVEEGFGALQITEPTSLNTDGAKEDDEEDTTEKKFKRTTRSQTQSRFGNLPDPKSKEETEKIKDKPQFPPIRDVFNDQDCYVMDAKSMGNLGRYLNHCCQPNVFVQNVFIDTHDLRFPWVSFFAAQYIRAGTELTWDYNYEVGSVPGKVLYCYCGAAECRGRLL